MLKPYVKDMVALLLPDFDGDDMISSTDLKEVINRLTGDENTLSEEQMQQLIDNVMLPLVCEATISGVVIPSWVSFTLLSVRW